MSDTREIHAFSRKFLEIASEYASECEADLLALGESAFYLYVNSENGVSSRLKSAFFESKVAQADDSLIIWENLGNLKLPTAKWKSNLHFPFGQIDEKLSEPFRLAIDRHTGTISVYDKERRLGAVWRSKLTELPYWAVATPFRVILSWFADQAGAEFVHSAAISRDDDALLISGPSGSGKSTLSLSAALNGYDLISDDYTIVKNNRAYSVYTRGKLHESEPFYDLVRKGLAIQPSNTGEKKVVDLLNSPIRVASSAQIRGVILPIFAGLTAFAPMRTADAFRLIAPYSISGLLGGNSESLRRIAKIVKDLPSVRFALSSDHTENSMVLDEIFEQVTKGV